jgi:GMP synthase (glutamine-hydrolysing)
MCQDEGDDVSPADQATFDKFRTSLSAAYRYKLVPVRTVGVKGDQRSYAHLCLLQPTAGPGTIAWQEIYDLGRHIANEMRFVNRAAWLLHPEPVTAPIVTHPDTINRHNTDLIREIDFVVRERLKHITHLNQVFAVLLPMGVTKQYSVAIRSIITQDFMTGRPGSIGADIPLDLLHSISEEIRSKFDEIDLVMYDITAKPPATVEWQ